MRHLLSILRDRTRRRIAMTGVSLGMAGVLLAACVPGTPGMLGNTSNCNAPIRNGYMSFALFVGHKVNVNYSWCHSLTGIHYISPPAVSTPTSSPIGGVFESVHVSRLPYLTYISNYHDEAKFDVQQTIFHIGGTQTFTGTLRWDTGCSCTSLTFGHRTVYGP